MRLLSSALLAAIFIFLAPVVAGISADVTKDAPKARAQNETIAFKTNGGGVHERFIHENS